MSEKAILPVSISVNMKNALIFSLSTILEGHLYVQTMTMFARGTQISL